jgi:ABC-type dipeptide/oligopeptide/nickel transport system permease component
VIISLAAIVFTWAVALSIGIYSAVYRYSFLDYAFTFVGFVGLAIPGFMLALVVKHGRCSRIVDEIGAAGYVPRLVHARKAKLMIEAIKGGFAPIRTWWASWRGGARLWRHGSATR